jgi:hypothetical protein
MNRLDLTFEGLIYQLVLFYCRETPERFTRDKDGIETSTTTYEQNEMVVRRERKLTHQRCLVHAVQLERTCSLVSGI